MPTSPVQIPMPPQLSNGCGIAPVSADAAAGRAPAHSSAGGSGATVQSHQAATCGGDSCTRSGDDDDEDDGDGDGDGGSRCPSRAAAPEQRWVPYRHTNGVAIYHHHSAATGGVWGDGCCSTSGGDGGSGSVLSRGSEYMASSIVRGSPDECLAVLVDPSSNTTILGPASSISLLEADLERFTLRMSVEATGMARRLCAPREVIVECIVKRCGSCTHACMHARTHMHGWRAGGLWD